MYDDCCPGAGIDKPCAATNNRGAKEEPSFSVIMRILWNQWFRQKAISVSRISPGGLGGLYIVASHVAENVAEPTVV